MNKNDDLNYLFQQFFRRVYILLNLKEIKAPEIVIKQSIGQVNKSREKIIEKLDRVRKSMFDSLIDEEIDFINTQFCVDCIHGYKKRDDGAIDECSDEGYEEDYCSKVVKKANELPFNKHCPHFTLLDTINLDDRKKHQENALQSLKDKSTVFDINMFLEILVPSQRSEE